VTTFTTNVLIPLVVNLVSSVVIVLLGVRSIKDYIRDVDRKRSVGMLTQFWSTSRGSNVFNLVFGAEWYGRQGEIEPRFGYAQAYGVSEVIDCLEAVFEGKAVVHLVVLKKDDPIPTHLFEENIVIFGGAASISQFEAISRALEVPYYQYSFDHSNRSMETAPARTPKEIIASTVENGELVADIGTVTRLVNPTNRRLVILFNGNYGAGLLGGVIAVTRNGPSIQDMQQAATAQQLVVKVSDIVNNIIDQTHTVEPVRPWLAFDVPASALRQIPSSHTKRGGVQPAPPSGP